MKREAKRTRPRKEENPILLPLAEAKRVKLGERITGKTVRERVKQGTRNEI